MNSLSEEEFQVIFFSSPEGKNQIVVGHIDWYAVGKARLCLLNMDCWAWIFFGNIAAFPFGFYFIKKS